MVIACMDCWKEERKRQRMSESLLVQQINWDNSNKLLFVKCCLHVVMYEQEGRHSPYRTYSYITFPAITTHRLPLWYHHLFSCASGSLHSVGVDIPNSGDTSDISVHCGSIRRPRQRWHDYNTEYQDMGQKSITNGGIVMENVKPKEQTSDNSSVKGTKYLFVQQIYLLIISPNI